MPLAAISLGLSCRYRGGNRMRRKRPMSRLPRQTFAVPWLLLRRKRRHMNDVHLQEQQDHGYQSPDHRMGSCGWMVLVVSSKSFFPITHRNFWQKSVPSLFRTVLVVLCIRTYDSYSTNHMYIQSEKVLNYSTVCYRYYFQHYNKLIKKQNF